MADTGIKIVKMKKWMRHSSLNFLERNPDLMGLPGYVSLAHPEIVKVMAGGFEVMLRDSHFISIRARQILSDNVSGKLYKGDELFKSESALNQTLMQLHEYFDTRLEQATKKLESGGFSVSEVQRHETHYETLAVTNAVTEYLNLIVKADHYSSLLHYLWIFGELSDSPDESLRIKLVTEKEIRVNLFAVTRDSTQHYSNIRRLCNGVLDIRRKEREEQSLRDKAREKARQEKERTLNERRERREANKKKALAKAQVELNQVAAEVTA